MKPRKDLIIAGCYTLLTIILTYPVAFNLGSAIAGFKGEDNLQWRWFLWWFKHALLNLHTSVTNVSILYAPTGGEQPFYAVTAYIPALALPLTLVAGPTVSFNLSFLLAFALSGYTAYLLAYYLKRNRLAAFIAGLIFAFYPARFGYATGTFLGQLTTYFLPLYLLGLFMLAGQSRHISSSRLLRRAIWTGLVLACLCLTWPLHIVYGVLIFTLVFLGFQVVSWLRRPNTRNRIKYFAVAFGLAVVLILGPYLPLLNSVRQGKNNHLGDTGTTYFALDVLAFIAPSTYHPVLQPLDLLPDYASRVLADRDDIQERLAYVGIVPILLVLAGLIRFRKELLFWLITALIAVILSLGPLLKFNGQLVQLNVEGYIGYVVLPYALIRSLPILDWSGVLGRLNGATMLCVAVMAAYGIAFILSKIKKVWQPAIVAGCSLLILFEFLTIFPFPTEPDTVPAYYYQLEQETTPQQIVDLPLLGDPSYNNYSMHYQTVHQQPIAGGHFIRKPAGAVEMTAFINQLLSPPFDQPALNWPPDEARLGLLNKFGFTKVVARSWLMADEKSVAQLAYLVTWLGPSQSIAQEQHLAASSLASPKEKQAGEVAVFNIPPGGTPSPMTTLLAGAGWQTPDAAQLQLQAPADLFVYVDSEQPQPVVLQLTLSAPEAERYLAIIHNDRPAMRLYLTKETLNYSLPLALSPGVHQFTFRPEEACEKECAPVNFSRMAVEPAAAPPSAPVAFGNELQLVGSKLSSTAIAPGQPLLIFLYWQSQTTLVKDYSAFVHLVAPTGELIGQANYLLGGWLYPTSAWPEGYLLAMPSLMFIPPDALPGTYQVQVGVYQADTGERLPLAGEQTDFFVLSTLMVEP